MKPNSKGRRERGEGRGEKGEGSKGMGRAGEREKRKWEGTEG